MNKNYMKWCIHRHSEKWENEDDNMHKKREHLKKWICHMKKYTRCKMLYIVNLCQHVFSKFDS